MISLAFFCIIAWATSFTLISYGVQYYDPYALGFARFSVAAIVAAIYLLIKRPSLPSFADMGRLAFCALIGISLYAVCLNVAQIHISAGLSSFVTGVNPLITLLLSIVFIGEKPNKYLWGGMTISLVGLTLISFSRGLGTIDVYVLLIILASFGVSVANIIQRQMLNRMTPLTQSAWSLIFGAMFLLPFAPLAYTQFMDAPVLQQLNVLYLGIVPAFLAYTAYTAYMMQVGAARASTIIFAVPFFASLLSYFALGQTVPILGFIGGVIALIGVAVAQRKTIS